jgi:ribosomal small subunit protein bTHX
MVDNRNLVIDPTLKHTILLGQTLTLHTMGKGDLKTKKGKRAAGSTGKSRPAKRKTRVAAAKKATAKKAAKKAAPKKATAKKATAKKAAPKKATKAAAKKK